MGNMTTALGIAQELIDDRQLLFIIEVGSCHLYIN